MGAEEEAVARTPLEALGVNEHKLSGTSFILRDFRNKYIYKVIKMYSATEALFYSIAYRTYIPYLNNFRVNKLNSSTFNNLSYLVDNKIIPYFYGLASISQTDRNWYELDLSPNSSPNTYKAIKLENLLEGFNNPGIIDIKLGSHNVNPDSHYGEVDDALKAHCVEMWRRSKNEHRNSVSGSEPVQYQFNLNAADLGLPESYNQLDAYTLHTLVKTWRQRQIALETTEHELGFRISSIYVPGMDENYTITSSEAKSLTKNQAISILKAIFKDGEKFQIKSKIISFLTRLRDWISIQDSISIVASSILIVLDQHNRDLHKIKWIDFTHIDNNNSITFLSADHSNMVKGINSLIGIIDNA